jgi:hypothetical protein
MRETGVHLCERVKLVGTRVNARKEVPCVRGADLCSHHVGGILI